MVSKPAGLPMHPNLDPDRPNLVDRLRAELGIDYLGIHQRLDLETSGVVLFALDRAVNANLAAQFEGRRVEKVYHALCLRPKRLPPERWSVSNQLAVVGKKRQSRTMSVAQGQAARTDFRLLEAGRVLAIEACPRTGRKHQIRCHLAEAGLPIVGDTRYGGPPARRMMLHARRLSLTHPVSGQPLEVEASYPFDWG